MYLKKNQEYSTLASYGEYYQKQKELEDRLAEKFGFRKKDEVVVQNLDDPVYFTTKRMPTSALLKSVNPITWTQDTASSRSQLLQPALSSREQTQGYAQPQQADALDQLQQEYAYRGQPAAHHPESLRSEQPQQHTGYREMFRPEMPQVPPHLQMDSLHQQPTAAASSEM